MNKLVGFTYNKGDKTSNYIYRRNLQGDIIGIYDSLGNEVGGYAYDAYGKCYVKYKDNSSEEEKTILNTNPFRYRGYYYDNETGLYYLNARYYDPSIGRFISPDVLTILDETKGQINGLNLYMYCNNNPIMYVDPSGCLAFFIITAIIGAVIGFGTALYIDYKDDGQIFNGSVKLYEYLGTTILGGLIGAGLGAFAGMSFAISIPTFGWMNAGGALALCIKGTATLTITGSQVLTGIGALTLAGSMMLIRPQIIL